MQKAVRKKDLKVIERPVSLRDTLEKLKAEGDLIESDKPVNPDLELTGYCGNLCRAGVCSESAR